MQIFAQAQLVAHAEVSLSGDLRDQGHEPVGGGSEGAVRRAWSAAAGGGRRGLHLGQPRSYGLAPHFAGRGARQIGLRPQHPAADALEVGQFGVGPLDGPRGPVSRAPAGQHGARFRAVRRLHGHHRARRDLRLLFDGRFNVFGMNVEPRCGNDHLALAAQKLEFARFLPLGNVARGQPLVLTRTQFAALPDGAGDHGPAHQHFAVRRELHLAPGHRLADGAFGHMEGMVERDERGRLGQAVALYEHESERIPELFKRPRQRAAAGDEGPELEAKLAMHRAEAPPPAATG